MKKTNDMPEASKPDNITVKNNGDEMMPPPPPVNEKKVKYNSSRLNSNKLIWIISGVIIVLIIGALAIFVFSKFNKDGINFNNNTNINKKDIINKKSCENDYNKLLEINGFDFDKYCIVQGVRSGNYDANAMPQKKKNLVLIFDASGSMATKIDGKRKIDIAKEAAWKFIDQSTNEKNFSLSIIVYGHKGGNSTSQKALSCKGIEEIYYLGPVNAEVAKSKLNKFDATGWTPIAGSLKKAQEILSKYPDDENFILLVSDGKEMCDGDPVTTIKEIKNSGLNVKADVIGFDVGGADETQLKAIAEAGDGNYFSVSSAIDLENAFAKHKEMLNKADYKIGRVVEQLYDVSFVINNYNQCRVMLEKERAAMMLDIHASKLVGEKCESFADEQYMQRFEKYQKQIQDNYEKDKTAFDTLK